MHKIIEKLQQYIPQKDLQVSNVSDWSVGYQIEHCTKVIYGVCQGLINSDPASFKYKFNFFRIVILLTGYIPRGKAKAPKAVQPKASASTEELNKFLNKANELLTEIDKLDKNAYFDHPYFGMVNLKLAKRFIEVHTNHHIKIIKDIIKASN